MSILPSRNLGSSSSSSSSKHNSQNPNPNHGSLHPDSPPLQSLQITHPTPTPTPPFSISHNLPESVSSASEDSGGSSQKVNKDVRLNGKKNPNHQKGVAHIPLHAADRAVVGFSQHRASPQSRRNSDSTSNQGASLQSAGRKTQMVNGNHLLNFHYDPISRPQSRAPPPRRLPKRKPYNKDLFLQANYKFVLLDAGNHAPETMDPDKMLQWEDIICLKYFTPHPIHCPICLEEHLCPQMTSCGHIFCFPCILRYFLIGDDDGKHERWKKCPLCFMMISSKVLYTIYVENVKQHCVGDIIEFRLLTRQKDSLILTAKGKEAAGAEEEVFDSFSKFTFTGDVELSVRKAISELDSWLARAESGLVDDLEKLPYVCAAMEQLEERKKYWNEQRVIDGGYSCKSNSSQEGSPPTSNFGIGVNGEIMFGDFSARVYDKPEFIHSSKLDSRPPFDQTADMVGPCDDQDKASKHTQLHVDGFREKKIKDSYYFYQAADGQHLILHPLNMKSLLHHYGSYDTLPQRIGGKILQLETVTQSEAIRRRYRYLSHFSLTTTFQLCEINLSEILPLSSLSPFEDELKAREKQRKRIARKEQEEKKKAEAAAAAHYVHVPFEPAESSYDYTPAFSMDDFEALGSSSVTSSSPPTVEERPRPLFSNVARLGFAAATDSPLRMEEAHIPSGSPAGLKAGGTSFANVISRTNLVEPKVTEIGKKGKKATRVLLSTSGGRRY